jgi:hypothetical protein
MEIDVIKDFVVNTVNIVNIETKAGLHPDHWFDWQISHGDICIRLVIRSGNVLFAERKILSHFDLICLVPAP